MVSNSSLSTPVSPAETVEPITVPFGLWIRVGPANRVPGGARIPPKGKGSLGNVPPHV